MARITSIKALEKHARTGYFMWAISFAVTAIAIFFGLITGHDTFTSIGLWLGVISICMMVDYRYWCTKLYFTEYMKKRGKK